jgi:hypothetical protein
MTVPKLLAANESSALVYERLAGALAEIGVYTVEEKKTSLHISAGKAAFLGVHPRKQGVRLNLVLSRALESPRLAKVERVSANRFHNELDVREPGEVDAELVEWLREARER